MDRILEKLNNKNIPQKVSVRIEELSTLDNCFYNVLDKISIDYGKIVYGWKLHNHFFLLEAERHAVWESPTGKLIDITPNILNQEKILFLREDKEWKYEGKYSDNVRVNITNNPLVDDLISLRETITKLWQTGIRKSRMEVVVLEPVNKVIEFLEKDNEKMFLFILNNSALDSRCYCDSSLPYKECHGFERDKFHNEILKKAHELRE